MILLVEKVKSVAISEDVRSDGTGQTNDRPLLGKLCWMTVVGREVKDAVEDFIEKHVDLLGLLDENYSGVSHQPL